MNPFNQMCLEHSLKYNRILLSAYSIQGQKRGGDVLQMPRMAQDVDTPSLLEGMFFLRGQIILLANMLALKSLFSFTALLIAMSIPALEYKW